MSRSCYVDTLKVGKRQLDTVAFLFHIRNVMIWHKFDGILIYSLVCAKFAIELAQIVQELSIYVFRLIQKVKSY